MTTSAELVSDSSLAVETPVRRVERKKESLVILAEASAQAHSSVVCIGLCSPSAALFAACVYACVSVPQTRWPVRDLRGQDFPWR